MTARATSSGSEPVTNRAASPTTSPTAPASRVTTGAPQLERFENRYAESFVASRLQIDGAVLHELDLLRGRQRSRELHVSGRPKRRDER